jgi:serine/threonine-protein kinase
MARLASGGMAEIFLATQTGPAGFEKLVVIKKILPGIASQEGFVRMFLDEARLSAMLDHKNVVQVFDLGEAEGEYFLAMEYLAGENLATILEASLQRGVRMPPQLAAGIVMQAAEGLHYAHTRRGPADRSLGIVHRDISPQNVFVLYDGAVKVVDFGIAKAETAFLRPRTRTGMVRGKMGYMSPEQVYSEKLDARSDIFSLGVVFWECLTHRRRFHRENQLATLQAITGEDAPSPAMLQPSLPEELCHIALRALAREPAERFQSAAEMHEALAGWIRESGLDADTAAIGGFMHSNFAARREAKQKRIREVPSAEWPLSGSDLFGDLDADLLEETVPTLTTPGHGRPVQRRSRTAGLAVLLVLVCGLASLLAYLTLQDGAGQADAGSAELVVVTPTPSGAPDAGAGIAGAEAPAGADRNIRSVAAKKPRSGRKRRNPPPAAADPVGGDADLPSFERLKKTPGKLRITTVPWTFIYHQGRKIGQTPLIDVEFQPGVVELRAVNPEAGIDRTFSVIIRSGEVTVSSFSF